MNKGISNSNIIAEPLVSVIIPVYNVAAYLSRCLDSIIRGEYNNLEIICVDDGSPDNCGSILDKYAEQDKRIKVVHQQNLGVAAARNNGLSLAKGNYIAFIDSDDCVHPLYIRSLMNCLLKKNADIVICRAVKFTENEDLQDANFEHIHYEKLDAETLFKRYYARHMVWGRIYKKRHLKKYSFEADVKLADDTLYNLSVISSLTNPQIYECDAQLYYYFIRNDSIVHSTSYHRLIQIGDWYNTNMDSICGNDDNWNWLLLLEVIKTTLAYRYEMLLKKDYKNARHAHKLLICFQKMYCRNIKVSNKSKALHSCMIRFPIIYRVFRILEDPTMIIHEKDIRTKLKEHKTNT